MHGTSQSSSFTVVLAGYAAGAAWFWLDPGEAQATALTQLTDRGLIAFLLPTAAAVLLWLFHAIELRRPVCPREPGDSTATWRILFRIVVFIGGLHGLVLLLVTGAPWIRAGGVQLPFALVGALLVSVGNLLPTTRPNALVGIRTSRSLGSRYFWMEMNRVAGYVSVAVGLVMIAAPAVLQFPLSGQVVGAAVLAAVCFLVARYLTLVRHSEPACGRS